MFFLSSLSLKGGKTPQPWLPLTHLSGDQEEESLFLLLLLLITIMIIILPLSFVCFYTCFHYFELLLGKTTIWGNRI